MMLNLTLLLQLVHFLIVYQIMVRLFFRPAWHAMQHDRDQDRALSMAVLAAEEVCRVKRQRVEQERASCAARLRNLMPVSAPVRAPVSYEIPVVRGASPPVDAALKASLIDTITRMVDAR